MNKIHVCLGLLYTLLFTACTSLKVNYSGFTPAAPVKVVVQDMSTCFKQVPNTSKYHYEFVLRPELTNGTFGYAVNKDNVQFYAGDQIGLAHAAYTLMEDMGFTFDITGISKTPVNTEIRQLTNKEITPKVRWRGIRQHVNFPMDISSYPIEKAKEYLNSLLRLRFNKLTIHSYPGQWYETHYGDSLALAGNFFYGNVHFMYDNEFLKEHIPANDSIFCIPAAEPLFSNPVEKSKFAVRWMQELIAYAHDLGFYIQFSFEPRTTGGIEQAVRTAKEIKATYPQINALEMITEETGGWGPRCTSEEVKSTLAKYFAPEIANDSVVCSPIRPQQSDLNALYTQMGIIAGAIKRLEEEKGFGAELKAGIYCSMDYCTPGVYRLARLALPNHDICLMPSHGSDGTATEVAKVLRNEDDMRHTELYSWVEFDGLMYLQQNSIEGNDRLMSHLCSVLPNEQIKSLAFNHWRTAENRTNMRYASEATLAGVVPAKSFYESYGSRLGIADIPAYSKAMELLNEADKFAKIYLGNIGFCWMGAWRIGGSYSWMKKENIEKARSYHMKAGEILSRLIAQSKPGSAAYNYLSLLGNRILCTVIYLNAFDEAVAIQSIKKESDGSISPDEQKRVREICDKALLIFNQYMEVFAKMMPDRGCEGTLVSLWNAPMRGLKILRSRLGNVPMEEIPHTDKPIDAPPLPIFYETEK